MINHCGVSTDTPQPHFAGPEGWALDLDRTLMDSQTAADRLIAIVGYFGIDGTIIQKAQKETEADGGTFAPLSFVEAQLDEIALNEFGEAYLNDEKNVLYDDTATLLYTLHYTGTPHLIPTYGRHVLGQYLKGGKLARQTGRSIYMEVMSDSNKGTQEESWRGPQGTYDFEALNSYGKPDAAHHVRSMVLVDDKDTSHANTPADSRGLNLKRAGATLKSQNTGLPENVKDRVDRIPDLWAAAAQIKTGRYIIEQAGCSPIAINPHMLPHAIGFRPAYPNTPRYPGLFITPATSFEEMREAAFRHKTVAT